MSDHATVSPLSCWRGFLPKLVHGWCFFFCLQSNVQTGRTVHQIPCRAAMNSVEWNPKHNLLAYAGDDKNKYQADEGSYLCIGLSYLSFLTWSHFTKSVIIFSLQVFLGSLGLKVHEKWINYGEFSNSVILYYVPSFLAKCIEFQLVAFTIKLIIFPLETTICGCLTSWKVHHDKLRASDQILIWNNREIPSF